MKKLIVLMAAVSLFSFSAVKADATTIVSLSGGWNFASGDTVDMFETAYSNVDDYTKGGGAVHLDVWFGSDQLQYGGGIGYTGLFMIDDSFENGSFELVEYKTNFAYIPIYAHLRFFPIGGLYVGGLVGYYIPAISEQSWIDGVKQPDTADSGDYVFGVGLMVGYEVAIIDFLVIGVQLRYQAVFDENEYNETIVDHNTALMLTAGVKF